ncbi:hypothetical protein N9560_02660 [Hyphomicrobiales bacterium]|nr:hypothetical protein [Rhodobiaceae bacterium]MDB4128329.1 hypothetical protein [Hyphomicrobiales bacterium]MDB4831809.1 hypothetical protein [Hyphomicrobiales bacterium]MDC3272792.1 hypothetical protein [Hyphomicrobiales bacterium]
MRIYLFIIVITIYLLSSQPSFAMKKLVDCPSDQNQNTWNNCIGTYDTFFGKIRGEFKNGTLHGKGVVMIFNSLKVEGNFNDGKLKGKSIKLNLF